MNRLRPFGLFVLILFAILACSFPTPAPDVVQPTSTPIPVITEVPVATETPTEVPPTPTEVTVVSHVNSPVSASSGMLIYDVESSGTAPEKRAPYGDSYNINRLERPFQQDMTYIADMDIESFTVSPDADWFYVSINLIGTDPNNVIGINYGVELDTNHDGFGDYIILAQGPYTSTWDTANVAIFQDTNHDTGGLSSEKSDAPFKGDGYETQIFHGGVGDADADMAWVRMGSGDATIEFAFKKSWSGEVFMLGVMSDAGLKDVTQLDYVDRFTEQEAGSPVKDKKYYPLGALYAVDNTCQEAFGFKPNGYEPKLCPRAEPTPGPRPPGDNTSVGCQNPSQYTNQGSCVAAGCVWTLRPGVFTVASFYCTSP